MNVLETVVGWYDRLATAYGGAVIGVLKIAVAYLVLRYALNNIVGRIVMPLVAKERGGHKERTARMKTLAGVVRSTGNYVLTFILVMVGLKEIGVDTTPVLASAGVIGLAVGFGSQRLVRDVTTGFFLLAEDQFSVGDYVTIGGVTGIVQEIGMRTTRIRDDVGKLYIISNGDISLVCNHSAGLMSMALDIPLAASTDLSQVRAAVEAVADLIDDEFGEGMLEAPRVEGVIALTATQMTVRIRYRAVVTVQERVQMRLRELLRERFAAESIALA